MGHVYGSLKPQMSGVTPNRNANLLYPPFRELIEGGLIFAMSKNLHAHIFEGWRATERQAYLYAQGRTTPGNKVTWARPGESWHEYGLAVDLVFDGSPAEGIQWSWVGDYADEKKDDYDRLAVIMKDRGVEWLGDKNIERAHFQVTYGFTIQEAKKIVEAKGILGFWAMLKT